MPFQDQLNRPRRVTNPEDIIALLKGTPPPMPSGVAPPEVAPIVQPVAGAPRINAVPDKQKILDMMRGATANQPVATTPPVAGASIDPRSPEALNPVIQMAEGNETRAAIAGRGAGAGRIQTMIDHPTRDVNPDGSAGTVNRMSKKKAFLLGLLKGISTEGDKQGGHTWGTILGGGGAGAAIGIADPRSIQEWQRRDDVAMEQGLLNNQQRLGQQAANIEETQAQARQRAEMPAIEAEKIRVQKEAAAGTIKAGEATRRLRELEMQQRAEDSKLNREEKQKDRESREKVAGMRPSATDASAAEGESLAASTSEAATVLQAEHDKNKAQLTENEKAISQKEGIWQREAAKIAAEKMIPIKDALEQVKAADPDVASGTYAETVANTERLRKAVPENEARLLGMNEDVRKGTAKASRRPTASAGGGKYAGQRISKAKLTEAAKRLGKTPEETAAFLASQGAEIY